MDKVNEKIGTDYKLFNYYGAADAEHIIVAMGSVNDTIEETIDYLMAAGKKSVLLKFVFTDHSVHRLLSMQSRIQLSRSLFLTEQKSQELLASLCILMLLQLFATASSAMLRSLQDVTDLVPKIQHLHRS